MGSSGPPPRSSWRTPFRCGSSRWWSRRRRTRPFGSDRATEVSGGQRFPGDAPGPPATAVHPAPASEVTRVTFWEYLGSRHQQLLADAYQHASAVFQCMVVATVIGVLIGVV